MQAEMTQQLHEMDKDELKALRSDIEKRLKEIDAENRRKAKAEVERIAKENGFSVNELVGNKTSAGKRTDRAPKYQHPENPQLTWVGLGKQPTWFKEQLEKGWTYEDMLIDKTAAKQAA